MAEDDRFAKLSAAIERVEEEMKALYVGGPLVFGDDIPGDLRWKLLAMGSSSNDHSFWIERVDDNLYRAIEIESGVGAAPAKTPRDAMENYWNRIYQ